MKMRVNQKAANGLAQINLKKLKTKIDTVILPNASTAIIKTITQPIKNFGDMYFKHHSDH